ncbi:MAG: hypothetical protein IIA36_12560 [Proteobacteria bacterium]|nr:hypothetical protein [Pseudomonadota bacterium]
MYEAKFGHATVTRRVFFRSADIGVLATDPRLQGFRIPGSSRPAGDHHDLPADGGYSVQG